MTTSALRLAPACSIVLTAVLGAATANAAPSRVAVLGPSGTPVLARLERNLAALKVTATPATVTICTRDVVTRLVTELQVEAAVCTDGNRIAVWTRVGERLVLKEAVVVSGEDDRAQELAAAQAVLALQEPAAKEARPRGTAGFTIVANGADGAIVSVGDPAPPATEPVTKDAPAPRPPPPPSERITPRLVLAAGPGIAASRHGSSVAIWAGAEIGVSRYVALVPWFQVVPENRTVEATLGTASFRPTIFGFGFNIPILPPSSVIVPRVGSGYGILWMHVAPETATGTATKRSPEDLVAPLMYATTALSVKVASNFRVAAEGMLGVTSHDMVVRIGGENAAHWGVPLASLSLRAEWVIQ